jgi:16S rRNA processing protein RimM
VVGRIIRPHGIRGEVSVEVRTDAPGQRFAAGSLLATDPVAAGPLTVESARWHTGHLLVRFAGIGDRTAAEPLRGVWLTVSSDDVAPSADADEFHDYQLVGLAVETTAGEPVGTVADVLHHGQDLLVIERDGGLGQAGRGELLVPFVAAIAVEVDLPAGRLVIDPPPGLLELGGEGRSMPGPGRAP